MRETIPAFQEKPSEQRMGDEGRRDLMTFEGESTVVVDPSYRKRFLELASEDARGTTYDKQIAFQNRFVCAAISGGFRDEQGRKTMTAEKVFTYLKQGISELDRTQTGTSTQEKVLGWLEGIRAMVHAVRVLQKEREDLQRKGIDRIIGTNAILDAEQKIDLVTLDYDKNEPSRITALRLIQIKNGDAEKEFIPIRNAHRRFLTQLPKIKEIEEQHANRRLRQAQQELYEAYLFDRPNIKRKHRLELLMNYFLGPGPNKNENEDANEEPSEGTLKDFFLQHPTTEKEWETFFDTFFFEDDLPVLRLLFVEREFVDERQETIKKLATSLIKLVCTAQGVPQMAPTMQHMLTKWASLEETPITRQEILQTHKLLSGEDISQPPKLIYPERVYSVIMHQFKRGEPTIDTLLLDPQRKIPLIIP